jgi:hypothetical protein
MRFREAAVIAAMAVLTLGASAGVAMAGEKKDVISIGIGVACKGEQGQANVWYGQERLGDDGLTWESMQDDGNVSVEFVDDDGNAVVAKHQGHENFIRVPAGAWSGEVFSRVRVFRTDGKRYTSEKVLVQPSCDHLNAG